MALIDVVKWEAASDELAGAISLVASRALALASSLDDSPMPSRTRELIISEASSHRTGSYRPGTCRKAKYC